MDGPAPPLHRTGSAGGINASIPDMMTTRASPSSRLSTVAPFTATYPDIDTNSPDNWYGLGLPGTHVEYCSSHQEEEEEEGSETNLLIPIPAWTMSTLEASAHRHISPGARRFIVSTIRAYPKMMANPENLPPFIHPLSCRVGPEDSYSDLALQTPDVSRRVTTRHPFGLIMTCHSIAQMFLSRTAGEHDLLAAWQRIDIEHEKIQGEVSMDLVPITSQQTLYSILSKIAHIRTESDGLILGTRDDYRNTSHGDLHHNAPHSHGA